MNFYDGWNSQSMRRQELNFNGWQLINQYFVNRDTDTIDDSWRGCVSDTTCDLSYLEAITICYVNSKSFCLSHIWWIDKILKYQLTRDISLHILRNPISYLYWILVLISNIVCISLLSKETIDLNSVQSGDSLEILREDHCDYWTWLKRHWAIKLHSKNTYFLDGTSVCRDRYWRNIDCSWIQSLKAAWSLINDPSSISKSLNTYLDRGHRKRIENLAYLEDDLTILCQSWGDSSRDI